MLDLDPILDDLADRIVARLNQKTLALQPTESRVYPAPPEPEVEPEVPPAPVAEPAAREVTIDEVRKVLAKLDRSKAIALISMFGVSKLSELPADKYAELLEMAA